ncbi:MAG: hypothetical protein ACLVKI_14635, partial [Gordonibacter urolithinfaciens]
LVYSCDAKHFETLKALTKGYAAKFDAMHPDSVDNVYYETLRDWRGCSLNECFEVASTVEVTAVNKMRADLAAMGVYFEVARRPENLGYVVKFNSHDASMVERALCELDQMYGHPRDAQDVARAVAGYLPSPAEGVWKKEGSRSTLEVSSAGRGDPLVSAQVYPENGSWHVYAQAEGERFGDATCSTERQAVRAAEMLVEKRAAELGANVEFPRESAAARDLDGRKSGDYTLTMSTVEWDRAANIMAGPMKEDGIPFSLSVDGAGETVSFTFPSEHAAGVKAIADRYIKSEKENLVDFTADRFDDWGEFCLVAETGLVRDDALRAIRAEWIDVGEGRYSLEAYANAWDAEAVVGVSVYSKAVVDSDPSLEGWEVWGNADGPNFGERAFDDLAEAMDYAESMAVGDLAERGYEAAVGSRPEAPAQDHGGQAPALDGSDAERAPEAAHDLEGAAARERTVEQADFAVASSADGPSETVETVVAATKTAEVGGAYAGSTLESMTNPDGIELPSIERFGSADKLNGAKMSDVLDACAKDVQAIRKHSEAMRQQGVERRAASVAKANAPAKGQAKGGAAR